MKLAGWCSSSDMPEAATNHESSRSRNQEIGPGRQVCAMMHNACSTQAGQQQPSHPGAPPPRPSRSRPQWPGCSRCRGLQRKTNSRQGC